MSQSEPKLWTKDFIIVSSVNFFVTFIFYLLLVTISVYAVDEYRATTAEAGLVSGIFIIGTLIGRLCIGRAIDAIGRKRTLVIGLLLTILSILLYFIPFGLGFLLLARFLHGATAGMATTATGTIVAQIIPQSRKGEGIGYFSMSGTLATAIGPFIGIYMIQHADFTMIFATCLALGVICFLTALFVQVPALEKAALDTSAKGLRLSGFIEPKAVPIAFVTLAIAFCYSSVLSFINFYAEEIKQVQAASFFFLVYSIAVLASRPFTGRLMDQKGANLVMYPGFLLLGAGMLLLSAADSSIGLLASAAFMGLGFGNMQSCTQAIAIKLTPATRMGLATSTFFIFLDAGLGFGPYVLGYIVPITGYQSLYVVLGCLSIASLALYYFLHGKHEHKQRADLRASA